MGCSGCQRGCRTPDFMFINSISYPTHLDHQHDDECEDESGVEVRDVEGGAEASDEGVAPDDRGEEHRRQLGAQVLHQAATGIVVNSGVFFYSDLLNCDLKSPVQNSCPSDGQRHHHNQVGEEGKGAEDDVGP